MEEIRTENPINIPNLLTMVRIGLMPAIVWRFSLGDMHGALMLYLFAMLTDVFDGRLARWLGQTTALGKLLDPLADKLSLLTLLGLFVSAGRVSGWVLGFVLIKEILLMAGSAVMLRYGIVVHALSIGKVTTVFFVASMMAYFLAWEDSAEILLFVSLFLSLLSLAWYLVMGLEKLKCMPTYESKS